MILGMVDPLEGIFHDPCLLKKQTELFIIAEGIHTRKHVCCSKRPTQCQ